MTLLIFSASIKKTEFLNGDIADFEKYINIFENRSSDKQIGYVYNSFEV